MSRQWPNFHPSRRRAARPPGAITFWPTRDDWPTPVNHSRGTAPTSVLWWTPVQAVVDFKTPGEGRRCGRASRADSAICLMHNNLSSGIIYYFGVIAYNASGSSQMSDIVHCHTLSESQSTLPSMTCDCYVLSYQIHRLIVRYTVNHSSIKRLKHFYP